MPDNYQGEAESKDTLPFPHLTLKRSNEIRNRYRIKLDDSEKLRAVKGRIFAILERGQRKNVGGLVGTDTLMSFLPTEKEALKAEQDKKRKAAELKRNFEREVKRVDREAEMDAVEAKIKRLEEEIRERDANEKELKKRTEREEGPRPLP